MTVKTSYSAKNSILIISVDGKFDFNLLTEFRQAYDCDSAQRIKFVIDMRSTSAIDSSALGMLLNMQRTLKKANGEINIINCNHNVKKVFQITHFDKKFTIE